jgi:hypothetical protein
VTKSVDEFEGVDIPPNKKSIFNDRTHLYYLWAVIKVISERSAKVCKIIKNIFDENNRNHIIRQMTVILKLDPKIALPQSMINFFTKNIAGIFLSQMQKEVLKVIEHN